HLQLLEKLKAIRADSQLHGINDWRGFVATVVYNKVSDYLRRKHPRRYSLESKLRFLLDNQPDFASWYDERDGLVCGYAVWREQRKRIERNRRLDQLLDDPRSFARKALPDTDHQRLPLADL